ncbi:unnamed protein product, partial [Soboliphyme baturini]|uniref:sn-1-specific diacylglycerol lipase ABHD11 n=1 Tax=Soboliphyme baturini TaxID=241478 RepID=A0A183J8Z8_9BILA
MASMRTVLLRPSKYLRRHLSTDVVKLSYNVYGEQDDEARSKPPVVFVHGMLGHKSNLSSVCKAIHQRLHRMVVAPDLRNHGHSPHVATKMTIQNMADDVLAMLDDFSCRRVGGGVSLIGHSLGGKIVGLLALKNPSVVGSVVIEDVALR